ncbi:MAG: hypothetical protein GTO41_19540 [Burkholderiales bacterium]|nr:hypothetical protein [Burkholderiales bacterium]
MRNQGAGITFIELVDTLCGGYPKANASGLFRAGQLGPTEERVQYRQLLSLGDGASN